MFLHHYYFHLLNNRTIYKILWILKKKKMKLSNDIYSCNVKMKSQLGKYCRASRHEMSLRIAWQLVFINWKHNIYPWKNEKTFYSRVKSNRLIALGREDKLQGRFHRIDSLDWSEASIYGWVKAMDMPILLHRQIFKNKDGSEGVLYLISNDVELDKQSIETIYQKRWKVEVFHKNKN